ncbi:hypothetical protein BC332_20266 [Capsicum chinense]|nr:hypothetical protein BC332_20266 [Capsicum chinense]
MLDAEVRKLVAKRQWDELLNNDEVCDRILWLGKGIKQLFYKRTELRLSDHKPVSSMFSVEVEIFDHRKLQKVLHVNTAAVHPEILLDIEE